FGFGGDIGAVPGKGVVTGNPVRQEIIDMPPPAERYGSRSGPLRILVIGGSLGAQVLNETLPQALARMPAEQRPVVTHQSGRQHIEVLRAAYAAAGVEAELVDFIEDMPRRYAERSEEHTSELQSRENLVCRLLLEKKKTTIRDEQK